MELTREWIWVAPVIAIATFLAGFLWAARDDRRKAREADLAEREELREQAEWLVSHFRMTATDVRAQLVQALADLRATDEACERCRSRVRKAIKTWDKFEREAKTHLEAIKPLVKSTGDELRSLLIEQDDETRDRFSNIVQKTVSKDRTKGANDGQDQG